VDVSNSLLDNVAVRALKKSLELWIWLKEQGDPDSQKPLIRVARVQPSWDEHKKGLHLTQQQLLIEVSLNHRTWGYEVGG